MSRTVTTLSDFLLTSTEPGASPDALPRPDAPDWVPAVVPGGVHESLLAAGRIPHPYRDENEKAIRWIEEKDWWYRGAFEAPARLGPGERLRLTFLGLDTVAEIWLNGERLGSHRNMFRPAEFDITDLARERNVLVLRFSPPLAGLEMPPSVARTFERLGDIFAALTDGEATEGPGDGDGLSWSTLGLATLRRKATFSWGWDFGPRVPSIGIWRPVELSHDRGAVISGHRLRTDALEPDGSARVTVQAEIDDFAGLDLDVTASITTPSGERHLPTLRLERADDGRLRAEGELVLPNAELWWTHDLGEPRLHDLEITLRHRGDVVDRVTDRIGVRTIALDRTEDSEGGRLFRFVLNGVPIFARGANWLPASMLVGSVTPEQHRELIRTARDGGMTMLRIWGGGIYEHDSFYTACDELGVLVWHDFMFACTDYPSQDPELQAEVAAEAAYQVRRLRNRACLALWSGNNEVQLIHGFAYRDYEPGDWGWDFFHRILPETVAREDGRTPYWPGSPWGEAPEEGFMAVNGVLDGDRHAWEVWHGFDMGAGGGEFASVGEARHYRRYANDRGKFISEFGIHASPELGTLRRWISEDRLAVHSPTFDAHNKDNPKDKGDALLEIITGLPDSLEQYVDYTMVAQAEGLKFGIEHYRRRQPHTSGTLIWQFNDVWPGFSWSVVDHDGVPKAGYYFAKRAFSPVLASFRHDGDTLELWLSHSGRRHADVDAVVSIGSVRDGEARRESLAVTLAPGESRPVWTAELADAGPETYAWVESPSGAFPSNRYYFAEIKDIPFGDVELDVQATALDDGRAVLRIRSRGHAYFVHVETPEPGVRFSDNYLDLRDGDTVEVTVSGLPDGFDVKRLEVRGYAGQVVRLS